MPKKRAKTLTPDQLTKFLGRVSETSRNPKADLAIFLLSFRAGLRAQEIAGLEWAKHLMDADGQWTMRTMRTPEGDQEMPFMWVGGDIG